jgi:hypothetical protein
MLENGIHITKLMNNFYFFKNTAHSNSKKNFRLFDETWQTLLGKKKEQRVQTRRAKLKSCFN